NNSVVAFGNDCDGKIASPDMDFFEYVGDYADYVFVEADGSKRLPFKAPRENEPVYPPQNDYTIIVAGLSAVGCPINEKCHRSELLSRIIDKNITDILEAEDMAQVITSPLGQLKDIKDTKRVILVLNQADNEERINIATEIAKIVFNKTGIKTVITALNSDNKIKKICVEA
ncbi:MAG: selenium cofactor biosynthesis protein YqeC, partial [Oscillospiraceae bacterium]